MITAIERELRNDHQRISKLLLDLDKANENADRNSKVIFGNLEEELIAHSKAEDRVYYSELEKHEELEDLIYKAIFESKEEHKIIVTLLREISQLDITEPQWKAKCKTLKDMVERHVAEEEEELFKTASMVIDKQKGEELKNSFLEVKESLN